MIEMDGQLMIVVVVLALLVVAAGVLLLLARRQPEGERTDAMMRWASLLVMAAEKLYWVNEEKLTYVMEEMHRRYPKAPAAELRALVEAAVYGIKRGEQGDA